MITTIINTLGRWFAGVPWAPLSVGPGPTWTLRTPRVVKNPKQELIEFSVTDARYPKLSGALCVEFSRRSAQVRFCVTQSKGVISDVDQISLSDQGILRTGKMVLGGFVGTESELQLVRSWLTEKQRAA